MSLVLLCSTILPLDTKNTLVRNLGIINYITKVTRTALSLLQVYQRLENSYLKLAPRNWSMLY